MLKALFLSLTLALAVMATAQTNLVPNGSFEDTVNCDMFTQCSLLKAEYWRNPNLSTPDVYDCDLDRLCGQAMDPFNSPSGFYHPAFEGDRFSGGYYWYGPGSSNTREYLMVQLTEAMEAGLAYEVGLHYLLPTRFRFAVDHIGVWFGQDSLFQGTPNWLNVNPQVKLRDPVAEYLAEATWTALVDTFMAQGGETWMVIGNFDVAEAVSGSTVNPDALDPYAYYFIDLVRVELLDKPQAIADLIGGWQGTTLWLSWTKGSRPDIVELFDLAGCRVFSSQDGMSERDARWDLPSLANGIYLVRGIKDGWHQSIKVIKGGE